VHYSPLNSRPSRSPRPLGALVLGFREAEFSHLRHGRHSIARRPLFGPCPNVRTRIRQLPHTSTAEIESHALCGNKDDSDDDDLTTMTGSGRPAPTPLTLSVKEFIPATPLCFDYWAMGPYVPKKWLISREREDQPSSYSSNLEYSSDE
jgi:hypothetical protein